MSRTPVILLVGDDSGQARLIAQTLGQLGLPHPVHVRSGEEAILWVGAHGCDVCLLNYQLPGIDGLETLVRIHQRKPHLPVIMLSSIRSEQVAVAAFHAGVVDYVPKQRGFEDAVARLVQQVVQSIPAPQLVRPHVTSADIPDGLVRPTYQNRLRVIGRQLDLYGYRSANLLEVGGGFLVRALPPGSRTPEALEFPDRDFPQLVAGAIAARGEGGRRRSTSALLPTGYEDFLRALGCQLDGQLAEAVTVTDLDTFVAVGGVGKAQGPAQPVVMPIRSLLRPDDLAYLLDEAFRRRAVEKRSSGLGSVFGRT